ncbi:MAG: hypothetical protein LBQ81_09470 [Zoogloeaceae bacterium]|jgi:hypothetical protein|nr:hypothetical protein [Zoogloeaceae bacterium]
MSNESADARQNTNYATPLDFFLGRLDDRGAMAALNLDSEEDLFLLMAQVRLPMPRLPQAETDRMKKALHGQSSKVVEPSRTIHAL